VPSSPAGPRVRGIDGFAAPDVEERGVNTSFSTCDSGQLVDPIEPVRSGSVYFFTQALARTSDASVSTSVRKERRSQGTFQALHRFIDFSSDNKKAC
jgi:hypothetical protein